MEDENDYANRMAEMGFATVIVDGVTPRFKKKFTKSYTSAMIVSDLAETISFSKEPTENLLNSLYLAVPPDRLP